MTSTSRRLHSLYVSSWLISVLAVGTCAGNPPLRVTPINAAEAIFEPFWDPQLSNVAQWTCTGGPGAGLEQKHNGAFYTTAAFEWAHRPEHGPVLAFTRDLTLNLEGYDHLLISMSSPPGTSVVITAQTDQGGRSARYELTNGPKHEYLVDLHDATILKKITIEIFAAKDGPGGCGISWIGLQNAAAKRLVEAQWKRLAAQPLDVYLQQESFRPSFEPRGGTFATAAELAQVRSSFTEYSRQNPSGGFSAQAFASATPPEQLIGEYIGFANVGAFGRAEDLDKKWPEFDQMAACAVILKDPQLLRRAARYAIALAITPYWDAGFPCYFPGSAYEQRPFAQAAACWQLAMTLDLADEMFSDAGRDLIRRRLAEHGLGNINFAVWRWEYITRNNQLAAFSRGRLATYAMLARSWPAARPYMDLAYQELAASLNKALLSDGSSVEGSGYFNYLTMCALDGLWIYAKAKKEPLSAILPPILKKTADYVDVFRTTDEHYHGFIPVGDSQDRGGGLPPKVAAIMAAAMPDSAWADIFVEGRSRIMKKRGNDLLLWSSLESAPTESHYQRPAFAMLPESGYVASTRKRGSELVKLLICGNRAKAGHAHEDKGSFVLEFAGDTFAVDPGGWNYSDPRSGLARDAQHHNMLVPSDNGGVRPAPLNPLPVDVKPTARGDETSFHAEINATPGWETWYRHWSRTWDSSTPDTLTITDDYALKNPGGAEFVWMTQLPVRQAGQSVEIRGERGTVIVTAPDAAQVTIEELPLREDSRVTRIRFGYSEPAASKTVRVSLRLN